MMDDRIKQLSDYISYHSAREAASFPIDRYFLEPYINEILGFNRNDYILYNFEKGDITYSKVLMLCLPDLWENITVDDLILIIDRFTNDFSYYALLVFTSAYLEIDLIPLILGLDTVSSERRKEIKRFLLSQYPNLLRSEEDIFWNHEEILGIHISDWEYNKQKFLLDTRILPAKRTMDELREYIFNLDI
ncbi:hypothetical protein SAMN05660461_0218 [Chitinophaga ginsengisegetis]|uniref:Uncharacterized protein n=1 Tax=Chitinophaga ginsengisegetis TaxID=393003 RepID=A0A1T5N3M2_9BACT|nr:hypothetical protein [Chitinophaga ginsengisegetis]SKC95075.1 hypothetical protein SAMN05660461_0218 [Chitinophaga ginsengisegetis]